MLHKNQDYRALIRSVAPPSPVWKNTAFAFLIGGGICLLGQILLTLYTPHFPTQKIAGIWVTVTLIFLSVLFSALGLYDRLARVGGGGTLVPVTGFANAVFSPAQDAKSEGLLVGVGAAIFTVAGPVLLFGTLAGWIYGVIYYLISTFGG